MVKCCLYGCRFSGLDGQVPAFFGGCVKSVSMPNMWSGTYANRDIAYHFGMWISPKFQLLLVLIEIRVFCLSGHLHQFGTDMTIA